MSERQIVSCSLNFSKETQVPCVLFKLKKQKKPQTHSAISFINLIIFCNLELKSPRLNLLLGNLSSNFGHEAIFFLKHVT